MKPLYLHVGTPKTGTTSIQSFCAENQNIFEKYDFAYPIMPFKYSVGRHKERNGLFLDGIVWNHNGERDRQEEQNRWKRGFEIIQELFSQYNNVVISNETLWVTSVGRKKGVWEKIKKEADKAGYQVKIVIYFRNQVEFLESWWNQGVKSNLVKYSTATYDEYLAEVNMAIATYYESTNRLSGIFGKENIIVRRFDRKEFEGGLIQSDFLNAIGLQLTEEMVLQEDKSNLNLRLSGNMPELKRIYNTLPDMSWKDNMYLRGILSRNSEISEKEYPCRFYSRSEAVEFMKQFEEGNRKLAEEYIGDGRPLFTTNFKDLPKWEPDNPFLKEDTIRVYAMSDLELLHRIQDVDNNKNSMLDRLELLEKRIDTSEQNLKICRIKNLFRRTK